VTPQMTLTVCLPFKIVKRSKWFVASCNMLDVHSQGETEKKAFENLKEALELFLISCFERGTLEAVLKECGFAPSKTATIPLAKNQDCITIPLNLLNTSKQPLAPCRA
jgi:predicted RNase H-like HicB family nuclease